mmetsp:Transcript_18063/g.39377  ORF Transcript_18063/g.39377 Transcript_18063/m.39377 type:complete len:80 (+) Transcript_18063:540-779(+)
MQGMQMHIRYNDGAVIVAIVVTAIFPRAFCVAGSNGRDSNDNNKTTTVALGDSSNLRTRCVAGCETIRCDAMRYVPLVL